MTLTSTFLLAAWLAIALLGLAMYGLNRQLAEFISTQRRQPPSIALSLPNELIGQVGKDFRLLMFVSTTCLACRERLDYLDSAPLARDLIFLVVNRDDYSRPSDLALHMARFDVLAIGPRFSDLGVNVVPYGVLTRDGHVEIARPLGSNGDLDDLLGAMGQPGSRR